MFSPGTGVDRPRFLDRVPLGATVIVGALLVICLIWYGLFQRMGAEESERISLAALENLNYVLASVASALLLLGSIAIALLFRRQEQLHRRLKASKLQAEELLARNLKAVEDLTESERRFRDLAELSSDWFWEQDADLRFTALSADYRGKRLLATENIIGKRRWELPAIGVTEEQWREHRAQIERREPFYDFVYQLAGDAGDLQWHSVSGKPVYGPDGAFLGYRGTGSNITERKRTEATIRELNQSLELLVARRTEELKRLNRDLESFSYSVSHDLRAPLRAINGFAALLNRSEREALSPEDRRLLERIAANATKMGTLIDEMLDFSRISRATMSPAALNLTNLVNEVLQELRDINPAAEITVGPLSEASGDRAMLRQALANLIGNALKFTSKSENPRVEIGASKSEQGQEIYFIRDNGVGFDPRYADKLFNPFQRLHRESEFPGTGVGLVIVKKIIERHGGRVWAQSSVGQGAAFFFTLGSA